MWSTLKSIIFFPFILAALIVVGVSINLLIPFSHLIDFFSVIRRFASVFSFTWDTTTLWFLVGYRITIELIYWTWKATVATIGFFVQP